MATITEGGLAFVFPNNWVASKVDDWSFYRNQFCRYFNGVHLACNQCNADIRCAKCNTAKAVGAKAVDILAIDPGSTVWLIEIKDYRKNKRTKAIDLADEVATKVRDSLAMFVAASKKATDSAEKKSASDVCKSTAIRVVLHVEQAKKPTKLFPKAVDTTKVKQRLKQLIKFVDPHPLVVEKSSMNGTIWSVK